MAQTSLVRGALEIQKFVCNHLNLKKNNTPIQIQYKYDIELE